MQQDMPEITHSKICSAVAIVVAVTLALMGIAQAQSLAPPENPKSNAAQVAKKGIPESELASNAPDTYTVKAGDTLWGIGGLFLKSPWRWPELWGMSNTEMADPHRIFPGQQLFLEKKDGVVTLTTHAPAAAKDGPPLETVRISPRNRFESLSASALPTLQPHLIEPFLVEPNIVSEIELQSAPRIVAAQEGRVLLSRGDRAYVRGPAGSPVTDPGTGPQPTFRVFRDPKPLFDPDTHAVLGYEAPYVGKAVLVRSELEATANKKRKGSSWLGRLLSGSPQDTQGENAAVPTAAAIDIVETKEEMRVGDRLLAEPERQLRNFVPHAPDRNITGRIISVYGDGVTNAAQNQVVVISRGSSDGLKTGDVLAILKDGPTLKDQTDPGKSNIKIPNERNGLLMVFRLFDKLSYALILEIVDGVKVGDRVTNPR